MMKLIGWPMLLVTVSLTGIIWLTQALRYVDFIINRGLSIADFLYLAILLIPTLLMLIIPIAFFVAVIFSYNRLIAESELIVLKASGLSAWQLARPALLLGVFTSAIVYILSLYIMPISERQFKDTQNFLKENYASVLLQEEVFNSPTAGLTVFVRERDDKGKLKGILVHDSRFSGKDSTMMAEVGEIIQTSSGPRLYLVNGLRQVEQHGRISWLNFDSYNIDLSLYIAKAQNRTKDPKELGITELFAYAKTVDSKISSKYLAQAHQRLTWPLIPFILGLLAAMTLSRGEINRRGQVKTITVTSLVGVAIILIFFGIANVIAKNPTIISLLYITNISFILLLLVGLLKDSNMQPRESAHGIKL